MKITNLDLDTLRTLVLACDLGGYGQAAQRLGHTPSAVSLQMKRLQEDVGAPLFRKDGRSLALTEIGEIVLRYGRRMLELNDEVLDTARGASLAGSVRMGFAQDFGETILPQVLSRFTESYPLVQIEVHIDKNSILSKAIEDGELDLALGIGCADRPTARKLGELPLVWIANRGFVARKGQPLPLIMFEAQCTIRQRALEALDEAGLPWRIALVSPSLAGLWAGASAGLGVTVRADFALPESLQSGPRLFDLPELGSLPMTLHRAAGEKSPAVERLAEIVSDVAMKSLSAQGRGRGNQTAPKRRETILKAA
jgi:DNA-binding transcriptional LysR family regulator